MIYISHRGNLNGKVSHLENHPDQIKFVLSKGYQCEIDVWYKDFSWWLGHNYPQYEISKEFILQHGL